MVQGLLKMKAAMDEVLQQAFDGDDAFANTLKEAFEGFINQRQNKCTPPSPAVAGAAVVIAPAQHCFHVIQPVTYDRLCLLHATGKHIRIATAVPEFGIRM